MLDITTFIVSRRAASIIAQQTVEDMEPEISIETASGTLPLDELTKIINSNNSYIKLDNKIYRLSRIEGNSYKYINSYTDGSSRVVSMMELDINKLSGDFNAVPLIIEGTPVADLEKLIEDHINDNTVHITDTERSFWNNKVSAEAVISENEQDYRLNLKNR